MGCGMMRKPGFINPRGWRLGSRMENWGWSEVGVDAPVTSLGCRCDSSLYHFCRGSLRLQCSSGRAQMFFSSSTFHDMNWHRNPGMAGYLDQKPKPRIVPCFHPRIDTGVLMSIISATAGKESYALKNHSFGAIYCIL